MSNQENKQNQKSVSEGIKETAGAAFHTIHSALETTENAAMSAVDATTEVVNDLTNNKSRNNNNREK